MNIVHIPHTVLSSQAHKIETFDKKLLHLIEEMKATLLATTNPKGVGLAAPQVGESLQLFLTKPNAKADIRAFANPIVLKKSQEEVDIKDQKLEGCLSIPNIWGEVKRVPSLTLGFQDEHGNYHKEKFSGFLATIIQHETDHVNGILFTQRVLEQKGKLYQNAKDEEGKEILEEIHI